MNIIPNKILAPLTTFGIGGKALFCAEIGSMDELNQALAFAKEKQLPIQVLGGGSNVLISDDGFKGLVIVNRMKGMRISESGLVKVFAGENWDEVVAQSVAQNLAGIECLSGIPGTAGGALVQNVGAYGQTLSEKVLGVECVELATGHVKSFLPQDCAFEYRNSYFKSNPNKYMVVSFALQLQFEGKPTITYPDIVKNALPEATLSQVRDLVLKIRDNKGYLLTSGYKTAGSFFKNPIVTQAQFESLLPILGDASLNRYWSTTKGIKIAAAFLMQEAGFTKGYKEGNVGISPKHSLSIVNLGNAKAIEVKNFAKKIRETVLKKFGVELEEEVLYI